MENTVLEKGPFRILFVGADPTDQGRIRLTKELEVIRAEVSKNTAFEIRDRQATKPKDFLTLIMKYRPHVVHFSGHGEETGEMCFEDEDGKTKTVSPEALANVFKLNDQVKCVVLNACYSEKQVKAISPYVPIVIGTKHEISDPAAIHFSEGFYTALEADLSQKNLIRAFESGCVSIELESLPEHLTPIIVEGTPEVRFASEVSSALRSVLNPSETVYEVLKSSLQLIGKKMGLSDDVASTIVSQQIAQFEKHGGALKQYETSVIKLVEEESPITENAKVALSLLQTGLGLTDADLKSIHEKYLLSTD